jgi:hypothetical protein
MSIIPVDLITGTIRNMSSKLIKTCYYMNNECKVPCTIDMNSSGYKAFMVWYNLRIKDNLPVETFIMKDTTNVSGKHYIYYKSSTNGTYKPVYNGLQIRFE